MYTGSDQIKYLQNVDLIRNCLQCTEDQIRYSAYHAVAHNTCVVADNTCIVADNTCVVAHNTCFVADNTCVVADNTCAVADNT